MQPRAVLVLYEPGHKLKNYKHLLALGSNIVGRDNKCQVVIQSKHYFPQQYVANFHLTNDFMYIQALCDNIIQFKSNMQIQSLSQRKKQVFKYIQKSCRYLVPIEEIFYIGPYKAMVQIQSSDDLKNIHNLVNVKNFETPQDDEDSQLTKKMDIQGNFQNFQVNSDKTQKIQYEDENQFQPTLLINDDEPYMPTLLIDYDNSQHQMNTQTIKKNINFIEPQKNENSHNLVSQRSQFSQMQMFSKQKQKRSQKLSQDILYETIKKQQDQLRKNIQNLSQHNNADENDDFSMPDTVKDEQQKDNNLILQNDLDSQQMPATLKDDQQPHINNQKQQNSISKMKGVKSMYETYEPLNQIKMYKSQKFSQIQDRKLLQQDYQDDDLWGAFMGKPNQKQSNTQQMKNSAINQGQRKRKVNADIPLTIENHFVSNLLINNNHMKSSINSNNLQDKEQSNQESQNKNNPRKSTGLKKISNQINSPNINYSNQKKRLFKQQKKYRLVNICGFKPKPQQKLILRRRGFQIVGQRKQQNYQLLIIGNNCKATPKLLLALLTQKWIVSQQWLHDKDWQVKVSNYITGTINGLSWQIIQKNLKIKQIFYNQTYYLTEALEEYVQIVQKIGGNITIQLNKRKKLNIIINCECLKDQQFYKQNKNCKNWKFFDHRIIAHSILTGQVQFQKYKIDAMSF